MTLLGRQLPDPIRGPAVETSHHRRRRRPPSLLGAGKANQICFLPAPFGRVYHSAAPVSSSSRSRVYHHHHQRRRRRQHVVFAAGPPTTVGLSHYLAAALEPLEAIIDRDRKVKDHSKRTWTIISSAGTWPLANDLQPIDSHKSPLAFINWQRGRKAPPHSFAANQSAQEQDLGRRRPLAAALFVPLCPSATMIMTMITITIARRPLACSSQLGPRSSRRESPKLL